jgi:hypothetical protein
VFSDELMRSYEAKESVTFQRLIANQPIPGATVDEDCAVVVIDDDKQTISVTNSNSAQGVRIRKCKSANASTNIAAKVIVHDVHV